MLKRIYAMNKPTLPKIYIFKPSEIVEIRKVFRETQKEFARRLPVSWTTIRAWENGWRNPYGPSGTILQQLKEYTDFVKAEKGAALDKMLNRNNKRRLAP